MPITIFNEEISLEKLSMDGWSASQVWVVKSHIAYGWIKCWIGKNGEPYT